MKTDHGTTTRLAHGGVALALALALSLAACAGGDEAQSPGDGEGSTAEGAAFTLPLDTDILLATLTWDAEGMPSIGEPTNLTGRPDYDNQPHFLPDGSGLWYTANDPQSGQSDIWRYDFETARVTRVTMSSPESEYSAAPLPDGSGISTIRVEADSAQRLWRFDPDGSRAEVLLEDVAPVGYHAWVDEYTVVMFVLGDPPTLQRGDLRTGRAETLAEGIGRSIQRIPSSFDVSYVQRNEDGSTTIMRLLGDGSPPQPIIEGVDGADFHAWAPNGTLLQANGPVVYATRPGRSEGWTLVADFGELAVTLSRLAVSPDGSQIALVAEVAAIDPFSGD
jgi:hypothetical protein